MGTENKSSVMSKVKAAGKYLWSNASPIANVLLAAGCVFLGVKVYKA